MVTLLVSSLADRCYSNSDGEKVYRQIKRYFDQGIRIAVSFKGIDSVSSSFVNSAFIELLRDFSFEFIKDHLTFTDSMTQINTMIKRRFAFEVNERKKLINA